MHMFPTTPLSKQPTSFTVFRLDFDNAAQMLDKAFMSGVLVMTAFWATAATKAAALHQLPSDEPAKTSLTEAVSRAQGIGPGGGPAGSAAGSMVTATNPPTSIAQQPHNAVTPHCSSATLATPATAATAVQSVASAGRPGSSGHSTAQDSSSSNSSISSSLVGVEIVSSLSYLQFCRMRLTAYNALLKAVLPSISASSQVTQSSACCIACCFCYLAACLALPFRCCTFCCVVFLATSVRCQGTVSVILYWVPGCLCHLSIQTTTRWVQLTGSLMLYATSMRFQYSVSASIQIVPHHTGMCVPT